jgi:mannonate dehydratase
MKLVFRWYGEADPVRLAYIRQIPNISGVATAEYDVKPGEAWKASSLSRLKNDCLLNGLQMEVIESIPVSENIKLGNEKRDHDIEIFKKNLRLCGEAGVKVVCYNFMPVFDWLRTDLHHVNPDGSESLAYSAADFAKVDPNNLRLPGWDESYAPKELQELLAAYQPISHLKLFENLEYFLQAAVPAAEESGIKLAIHPDDPPWDIFGLPRIVSGEEDLDRLLACVDSPSNGLALCSGSLGAGRNNDIAYLAGKYAKMNRLPYVHLRNILFTDDKGSFQEAGHCSCMGSLDMAKIVKALVDNGFDGYVRPDHGRNIFGENGKPGYGLYDRALGCAYLTGLFEAYTKMKK